MHIDIHPVETQEVWNSNDRMVPDFQHWSLREAQWLSGFRILESTSNQYQQLLLSPLLELNTSSIFRFECGGNLLQGAIAFSLLDARGHVLMSRQVRKAGAFKCNLRIANTNSRKIRIAISNHFPEEKNVSRLEGLEISVHWKQAPYLVAATEVETYIAHWGVLRRSIHSLCKRSRWWNTVVAAIELRFDREELLSLPQYMAICPTGQCNASCEFCSVTINRTGIVKKQLPFEQMLKFLGPVANTIRMYGLEGNGEPTLYEGFEELLDVLTVKGARFYLISNGERLTEGQIEQLLSLPFDAVNFSLNACTAETHRNIMKMKGFERVVRNIKKIVAERSGAFNPLVSVSCVVTSLNIHEIRDFIDFSENELGVDRVLVRPLSELGNDLGVVEDLRELVPYESDIRAMLKSVADYLEATPRRAEIEIYPENFRAYRSDPPSSVDISCEPVLAATEFFLPRPYRWEAACAGAEVMWDGTKVKVSWEGAAGPYLVKSYPVSCVPGQKIHLPIELTIDSGVLGIGVLSSDFTTWTHRFVFSQGAPQQAELLIDTGEEYRLQIVIYSASDKPLHAGIDWGKGLEPLPEQKFALPHSRRWEVASTGANVSWNGTSVKVCWNGPAGVYLLKSYSVLSTPGQKLHLPIDLKVESGVLGIGVLGSDFTAWVDNSTFNTGVQQVDLVIGTGKEHRLQIVLYSGSDQPLKAEVDWGSSLEPLPEYLRVSHDPIVTLTSESKGKSQSSGRWLRKFESSWMPSALNKISELLYGKTRIYCQKPWTDLNNFTVDGRMDVCCIATGPSQERYALGNMLTQDFQSVWNGKQMREFRRTVNGSNPLPPCQRCPMAFAYQGPFFNPEGALRIADALLVRLLGRRFGAMALVPVRFMLNALVFRGFRRQSIKS